MVNTQVRAGVALLWTLIAIVVISVLGVAAHQLARSDRQVAENVESGQRAAYLADQALSDFFGTFVAEPNFAAVSTVSSVLDSADNANDPEEPGAVDWTNSAFDGADLVQRQFNYLRATVTVTPIKAVESSQGDVYILEARAVVTELTGSRPAAERVIRTFGQVVLPVKIQAALTALGGIFTDKSADHLHLDSQRKGKCGAYTDIPALATPMGNPKLTAKKIHFKPKDAEGWDSSATSYSDLRDSLDVDWTRLATDATYNTLVNVIKLPAQYSTLEQVPWNNYRRNEPWPLVVVHGSIVSTGHVQGFGLLIVDGSLTIQQQFHWRGVILTGKGIIVDGDKAHLHLHGAAVSGLSCTAAELAAAACQTKMTPNGKHLGVSYQQCDVETALAQMLELRPLTPSRHTRYF